uniref:Uncharacterized protein n=1 Tax=Anguilla anguilla TaxID=7936 RepID=A0A0E9XAC4_ANGAN
MCCTIIVCLNLFNTMEVWLIAICFNHFTHMAFRGSKWDPFNFTGQFVIESIKMKLKSFVI